MAYVMYVSRQGYGDMLNIHMSDATVVQVSAQPNGSWGNFAPREVDNPPPPEGGSALITPQMIEAAVRSAGGSPGNMVATSQQIADAFNAGNEAAGKPITTRNRAANVVGQCAQESAWFQTTKEYGNLSGAAYFPYVGRGFIQCTWDYNYKSFGAWCASKNFGGVTDPNYFFNNYVKLEETQWAAATAFWYFARVFSGKTLWEWCDSESSPWMKIGSAINRGDIYGVPYGAAERAKAVNAVLAVTPDPNSGGGGGSDLGSKAAAFVMARIGKYYYTQSVARDNPDVSGGTDCSGLLRYAWKSVAGIDIGGWTGTQRSHGTLIATGSGTIPAATLALTKPGDSVLVNWDYYDPNYFHTGMVIGTGVHGANTWADHGGPGSGPVVRNLATYSSVFHDWMIRRHV